MSVAERVPDAGSGESPETAVHYVTPAPGDDGGAAVQVPAHGGPTGLAVPLGAPVSAPSTATPSVIVTDYHQQTSTPTTAGEMAQNGRPRVASMPGKSRSSAGPSAGRTADPAAAIQEPIRTSLAPPGENLPIASVSTESLSAADDVSPKRQDEFERFFGKRLTEDWTNNHQSYAQARSRARAYSTTSVNSSISSASVTSDTTETALASAAASAPPADYLMVLATQSCDLQASLLLHGRLYLTRYHLCFRSNILGVKTEKIHPLKDLVSVQKGTTAKWIQNAIYVCMAGEDYIPEEAGTGSGSGEEDSLAPSTASADDASISSVSMVGDDKDLGDKKSPSKPRGRDRSKSTTSSKSGKARSESRGRKEEADGSKLYGYGSMADRDAMFSDVVQCWRVQAPDKHQAWMEKEGRNPDGSFKEGQDPKSRRKRSGTTQTEGGQSDVVDAQDHDDSDDGTIAGQDGAVGGAAAAAVPREPVKHTTCPGENLKELAIDATIALPLDETYKMLYHNRDFILNFYAKDKGIADPKISEWADDEEGKQQRKLDFVISINNPIGPSTSACNGVETIEIANEGEAYAIRSETRTPDVPTGKNFKVVTRTCLTQTDIRGQPATRVYCSTQVDWSSSSLLKSTVTPAVIKGQKQHYQELVDSARRWIRSHPDEFTQPAPPASAQDAQGAEGIKRKDMARGVSFSDDPKYGGNNNHDDGGIEHSGEMKVRPTTSRRSSVNNDENKSLVDYALEIPANPVMLAITALCAFLLIRDLVRLVF